MTHSEFDVLFEEEQPVPDVGIVSPPATLLDTEEALPNLDSVKAGRSNVFMKIMVVSCLVTIYAYVATSFYFFFLFRMVPDSLNYTFLPAIIAQLANMMLITRKEKDLEIASLKYAKDVRVADLKVKETELKIRLAELKGAS